MQRHYRAIILSAALIVSYYYILEVALPKLNLWMDYHVNIIGGTEVPPYLHRVLLPFLVEAAARLLPTSYEITVFGLYLSIQVLSFIALLLLLYQFFNLFFEPTASLIAILFAALTLTIAFRDHDFHPWSWLEAVLFTLGLIWLQRGSVSPLWFGALVIIASLNRETGIFLAVAYGLAAWSRGLKRADVVWFGIYAALSLAIFLGIRALQPDVETHFTLSYIFTEGNLKRFPLGPMNLIVFLGAWWVFIFAGWKYAPPFLKIVSLTAVPYTLLVLVFGYWHEVRLLVPMYPLLFGLALAYLTRGARLRDSLVGQTGSTSSSK